MNKIAATGFIALSMIYSTAVSAQPDSSESDARDAEEAASDDVHATKAAELARRELARKLSVMPSDLAIVRIEHARWNDSSLGCPRRGSSYLQVISQGYSVILEREGKFHEVHVSGPTVVVCDSAARADGPRMPTRAKGLQEASARARSDLAQRLRLDPKDVRVVRIEPQQWVDASLDCAPPTEAEPGPASGYKLHLRAADRTYIYHTDLERVFPCPPIVEE